MSEVSDGPVSTMPGSYHPLPTGTMCDDHSDRLAVKRVQGETDSFGCEYYDLCQECLNHFNNHKVSGTCDWCKQKSEDLKLRRDLEEGMSGRVYEVCQGCIEKDIRRIQQELDEYDF